MDEEGPRRKRLAPRGSWKTPPGQLFPASVTSSTSLPLPSEAAAVSSASMDHGDQYPDDKEYKPRRNRADEIEAIVNDIERLVREPRPGLRLDLPLHPGREDFRPTYDASPVPSTGDMQSETGLSDVFHDLLISSAHASPMVAGIPSSRPMGALGRVSEQQEEEERPKRDERRGQSAPRAAPPVLSTRVGSSGAEGGGEMASEGSTGAPSSKRASESSSATIPRRSGRKRRSTGGNSDFVDPTEGVLMTGFRPGETERKTRLGEVFVGEAEFVGSVPISPLENTSSGSRLARNRVTASLRRQRQRELAALLETEVHRLERALEGMAAFRWGRETSHASTAALEVISGRSALRRIGLRAVSPQSGSRRSGSREDRVRRRGPAQRTGGGVLEEGQDCVETSQMFASGAVSSAERLLSDVSLPLTLVTSAEARSSVRLTASQVSRLDALVSRAEAVLEKLNESLRAIHLLREKLLQAPSPVLFQQQAQVFDGVVPRIAGPLLAPQARTLLFWCARNADAIDSLATLDRDPRIARTPLNTDKCGLHGLDKLVRKPPPKK